MFERKFKTDELYILHISELIYYVPFETEGMCYKDYYTQEYYTIASSKDEINFKDVFKSSKYKTTGYIGFGVMRDIEESIPLKSYAPNIQETITRSEASSLIDIFVQELRSAQEETIEQENKKLQLQIM